MFPKDAAIYFKNCVYAHIDFFNWKLFVVGDSYSIKLLFFDTMLHCDDYSTILNTAKKGSTPPLECAKLFFDAYMNKRIIALPPCDFSLYTRKEQLVLRTLSQIPPGQTRSYSELALCCGMKNASRFIGNVMAKNIFPIIYPCHRIIKKNGTIGNYTGGVAIKQFLLRHERDIDNC